MENTKCSSIYSLIVEQMADAMVYSDKEGIICGWNAAAESLFGYTKDDAIGERLDLIVPEHLRDAHWSGFHRAMASGTTRLAGLATITRSLTRSKGTIYVEMSFAVVNDGSGEVIGAVAVARDATQRRQKDRTLREGLDVAAVTTPTPPPNPTEPPPTQAAPADSRSAPARRAASCPG